MLLACRPPAPAGDGSGSGAAAVDESAPVAEGTGEAGPATTPAEADGPPGTDAAAQTCSTSADCRTWQPSDWSAGVECCYEYPCDLAYVAINRDTWERQRAWQLANPFDCAAHLQEHGPCEARPPRCGLEQEPPASECVDGVCVVAWPRPWPQVDGDAQTCTVSSDCRPWRPTSTSAASRCCEADCSTEWVAINTATRDELDAWLAAHPLDCDATLSSGACAGRDACAVPAPDVACIAGLCALR